MSAEDERIAALSGLLDEVWDPKGVRPGSSPNAPKAGQYATFAPGILALLDRGARTAEVAWHLRELAHKELKLPPSGRENDVAVMLQRWHSLWSD